jgi:hypothetical protein
MHIQCDKGDKINVKLVNAYWANIATREGPRLVAHLTGKDEDGNTGDCLVWFDDKIADRGPRAGDRNVDIALDDLRSIGMTDRNPDNLKDVIGKPAQFYCTKTNDKGEPSFSLNTSETVLDAATVKSRLQEMLRGESNDADPNMW